MLPQLSNLCKNKELSTNHNKYCRDNSLEYHFVSYSLGFTFKSGCQELPTWFQTRSLRKSTANPSTQVHAMFLCAFTYLLHRRDKWSSTRSIPSRNLDNSMRSISRVLILISIFLFSCSTPLSNQSGGVARSAAISALPADSTLESLDASTKLTSLPQKARAQTSLVIPSSRRSPVNRSGVDYDIVYVRAPRYGDDINTRWPEVKDPIQMEPGADLVLLRANGAEEILVPGGNGAVVDPYVSFDGKWIYYSKIYNLRNNMLNPQRRHAPLLGADIYKLHIETREILRLTFQEWTPNTGAANWSRNHLKASRRNTNYLGYGIFNLGPCPAPGNKIIFTSSRNSFLPNKNFTFPNLQLFVMDEDGKNVEQIGHFNLGSALHPTIMTDGRVMFSSYEAQGLRDIRLWALWAIWPDGRHWEPLLSAFEHAAAFHFQTQLSNGAIVVEEYYNQNNNGFGSFVTFPPVPPSGIPPFGSPNPQYPSNPKLHQGYSQNGKPSYERYPFSPYGLQTLTAFTHGKDQAAPRTTRGVWAGKVTHPSGAPQNDLLLVWTPGPANNLKRPTNLPFYDSGIYRLRGGKAATNHKELILIKNDPQYNEMQPRAVAPYKAIYGVDEPTLLPWLPNDGNMSHHLPAGTPFGLVGTSSFYKRNTMPGTGKARFDGLDPFNTSQNNASSNWVTQGADAGRYTHDEIYAVRILAQEPTTHRSYGPNAGANFFNHANERLRILGEIPLRKFDDAGNLVIDSDGNPDTSFLAKLPADTPFTFQTLDKNGLVLNMSQTWHQIRPGEIRYDCGGCHAHAQIGTNFASTAAAQPDYAVPDLTRNTPLLSKNAAGKTIVRSTSIGAIDVEFYRDIKPILQRSCVPCHSREGMAAAGLVLDDEKVVGGYENTYHRLANDPKAKYGRPSMLNNGHWRQTNASRYIRKFQSRRSLLIWKIFGRRLDGWTNDDHPTETSPGDANTFPTGKNRNDADIDFVGEAMPPPNSSVPPLTDDDKMMFARWVDLGSPINRNERGNKDYGWFLDDLRPTLTLSLPRAGVNLQPLTMIRIGAFDYYSGLNMRSLSIRANFKINGKRIGAELASFFSQTNNHIWTMPVNPAITHLRNGEITISIKDKQGNTTQIVRSFSIATPSGAASKTN